MQTATARPLSLPHPAAPALVSAEHVPDLITEKIALLRDIKSLRTRCATLTRAMNDGITVAGPICTRTGMARIADLLKAGQLSEALGEVPVIRFTRRNGDIVGVEVALLERPEGGDVLDVAFGNMAVVGEID